MTIMKLLACCQSHGMQSKQAILTHPQVQAQQQRDHGSHQVHHTGAKLIRFQDRPSMKKKRNVSLDKHLNNMKNIIQVDVAASIHVVAPSCKAPHKQTTTNNNKQQQTTIKGAFVDWNINKFQTYTTTTQKSTSPAHTTSPQQTNKQSNRIAQNNTAQHNRNRNKNPSKE